MKARQSKRAKSIFSNETSARAVLRGIHKAAKVAKDSHIVATVTINEKEVCVKEIE